MRNTLSELQEIFRSTFGDDELEISESSNADSVEGWDSLTHINLIIAVEKHFKIKLATAEIAKLNEPGQNVGSFVRLIDSKSK
ncbi:MAG: Acyl carrier protein [Verrucomicrobiales bacterium]|nr:Acyl carrier protein [Verrucomicrobiales bacterium]MDB6129916.1 Acyl carrier protein [Verrucomicrobiales bacterium]